MADQQARGRGVGEGGDDRIDLAKIVGQLWLGRKDLLFPVGVSAVLAVIFLHVGTYYYTAKLTLVPTQAQSQSGLGQLGGLASLAGINISAMQSVSPFSLYPDVLKSRAVADDFARHYPDVMHRLFKGQWDEHDRKWMPPSGIFHKVMTTAEMIIGAHVTQWVPPSSAQLQELISARVQTQQDLKKPVLTISYADPDPAFARYFLQRLNESTDRVLRRMTLDRSSQYARYLENKLATVQLSELRQVLVNSLSEQETIIMMGSSNTSFAAQTLGPAVSSLQPTSPSPWLIIFLSVTFGTLLGGTAVLFEIPVYETVVSFFRRLYDKLKNQTCATRKFRLRHLKGDGQHGD